MNLNQGKRNKQAVQVLNKVEYDSEGNPIGMIEDPSNPASANFGTPREPRKGGCYKGDGSAYITITGLLSTDTVEVFDGSDMPNISNGRLDIASGDRIFGVKIFRAGELWAKYNCSENSGSIAYDSSGNGNHGTIVNAITTTPEENPNSIHQYQDVYSFENEEGYVEKQNYLFYSQTFENWGSTDLVMVDNHSLAPDGSITAAKITQTSGNSYKRIINFGNQLSGSELTVFTVYLKYVDWRYLSIRIGNYGVFARVDLVNKTIEAAGKHPPGVSIVELESGWLKCTLVSTYSGFVAIYMQTYSYSFGDHAFQGDGVASFLIWGAQISNSVEKAYVEVYENVVKDRVIPKNSSITLPPFKDVLGNNLQYVGKVPGKAKFVESSCFRGDGNGYLLSNVNFNFISGFNFKFYIKLINVLGTSGFLGARATTGGGFRFSLISNFQFYINALGVTEYTISIPEKFRGLFCMIEVNYIYEGYLLEFKINNELVFSGSRRIEPGNEIICIGGYKYGNSIPPSNSNIFLAGVELVIDDILKSYFPLCEPITDPSNHVYHDVSGNGNHATLINGTLANEGKQDVFHYLQRGLIKRDTGEIIPILEDESEFANGSLLDDVDAILQDTHSFLNTGTELEAYDYPALKQADKDDDFWYEDDGLGVVTPKPVQFDSLITQNGLSDKLFLDSSVNETIKNVRMYGSDLKGRQLNTENKLTNNV